MTWWRRARADLARPETPTGREELPFLLIAAPVIVVLAQLSDPGSAVDWLLVTPAMLALMARGLLPRVRSEVLAVVVNVSTGVTVANDGRLEVCWFLGVMVTLYAAWHLGSTIGAVAVLVLAAATPWVVAELIVPDEGITWTAWTAANLFTFVLGRNLRRQQALIAALQEAREALAEQAVGEERRRIARELHDLAGHTLAAVLLHVTGARHVLRRDVDEAERALEDAEAVGRASLDQIRATVAALRTSERGTDPALAGSSDIAGLVEEYRRAGLAIDADVAPPAAGIEGPVGTALHRIGREALANVARHAPGNRVAVVVDLDRDAGAVRLVVADHGRRPAAGDDGDGGDGHFGLLGMRERARAIGGDLDAGPTDDGWRVEATLPLAGAAGDRLATS